MGSINDVTEKEGLGAFPLVDFTADHGRADWLGYWDEFVQIARFKNWFVYVILGKTT